MADPKHEKECKEGLELKPDGWAQFERAVDAAVKGGPKHRVAKGEKANLTKKRGRSPNNRD